MTIISDSHRFVFVHIPKSGGDSLCHYYQPMVRWGDFVLGGTDAGAPMNVGFRRAYGFDKHTTATVLREKLGPRYRNHTWFSFVREPKRITESYYRFAHVLLLKKCREHRCAPAEYVARMMTEEGRKKMWPDSTPILAPIRAAILSKNFDAYIDSWIDHKWSDILSRFVCRDNDLDVQKIYKLENIDEFCKDFAKILNVDIVKLPHVNKSIPMATRWDSSRLKRYHDLMEQEYNRFGYTLP